MFSVGLRFTHVVNVQTEVLKLRVSQMNICACRQVKAMLRMPTTWRLAENLGQMQEKWDSVRYLFTCSRKRGFNKNRVLLLAASRPARRLTFGCHSRG